LKAKFGHHSRSVIIDQDAIVYYMRRSPFAQLITRIHEYTLEELATAAVRII